MKPIPTLIALMVLWLIGCAATPPSPTPTAIPPTDIPAPAPDEAFVGAVYHRLDVDDTIPQPGREATISLFWQRPTALFPENDGLVVVYEVPRVPTSQGDTMQAAMQLIGTAVGVANEQGVSLGGVEVIFYAETQPFIGFRAVPPWSAQDILAAPMAEALIETIKQKDSAATVTPTPTATPEGRQSG